MINSKILLFNKIEQQDDSKQQEQSPEIMQNEEESKNMAINESFQSVLANPLVADISNLDQTNLAFKKKRDIEDVFDQFNVSSIFINLNITLIYDECSVFSLLKICLKISG